MKAVFFANPETLRKWFERHHDKERELWVGYYRKATGKKSVTWPESVDQALCFGWIDGVRRRIDDTSYCIRFTPRWPASTWSAVNIRKPSVFWVMSAKKEETRQRRLSILIECSASGERIPALRS